MDYRCTGTKGRASEKLRKEKATRRRSHRHLPSTSGEARGLCRGPQENEGVLEEDAYQPGNTRSRGHPDETIPQNNIHRQACESTSTGSFGGRPHRTGDMIDRITSCEPVALDSAVQVAASSTLRDGSIYVNVAPGRVAFPELVRVVSRRVHRAKGSKRQWKRASRALSPKEVSIGQAHAEENNASRKPAIKRFDDSPCVRTYQHQNHGGKRNPLRIRPPTRAHQQSPHQLRA